MGDGLGRHNHHDLIHADVFVHLVGLDAGCGVAGDDDATVGKGGAVYLGEGSPGSAWAGVRRDSDLLGQLLVLVVGLTEPAAKVGLQVVRDAAPGFQQLLLCVDTALNVGLAEPEAGLHQLSG